MSTSRVQMPAAAAAAPVFQAAGATLPKRSWADIARAAAAPAAAAPKPAAVLAAEPAADAWGSVAQRMASAIGSSQPADEYEADVESVAEAQPEDEPIDDEEAPDEAEPEFEAPLEGSCGWGQVASYRPGPRGSRRCRCQGEVLVILGHYGWLAAQCSIDHPDADKHDGRIYFSRGDVAGPELAAGDAVAFYLYEDEQGLGAEDVRLCSSMPTYADPKAGGMRAGAATFVPSFNLSAPEFVPAPAPAPVKHFALAFVPVGPVKKAAPPVVGMNGFALNAALLSDDSDSDSEDEGSTAAGASSGAGGGASSDSEQEASPGGMSFPFEAPPGLPLPKGILLKNFRPPPGLSLC